MGEDWTVYWAGGGERLGDGSDVGVGKAVGSVPLSFSAR